MIGHEGQESCVMIPLDSDTAAGIGRRKQSFDVNTGEKYSLKCAAMSLSESGRVSFLLSNNPACTMLLNLLCVRSCPGVVSLKNGSLMTTVKFYYIQ